MANNIPPVADELAWLSDVTATPTNTADEQDSRQNVTTLFNEDEEQHDGYHDYLLSLQEEEEEHERPNWDRELHVDCNCSECEHEEGCLCDTCCQTEAAQDTDMVHHGNVILDRYVFNPVATTRVRRPLFDPIRNPRAFQLVQRLIRTRNNMQRNSCEDESVAGEAEN